MENIKRGYTKAKGKVKDLLRPASRQSALSTPARSPRSSQEPSATHDQGVSTTPSAIVLASQTAIVPAAIVTKIADLPALEVSAPEPSPQPERTPDAASTYERPPPVPPKLDTVVSVCDPLLTIMHGASDAFPPLKSELVEILEIWNRCEVRKLKLH